MWIFAPSRSLRLALGLALALPGRADAGPDAVAAAAGKGATGGGATLGGGARTPTAADGRAGRKKKARGRGKAAREPRFPGVTLYHVNRRNAMVFRPYDAKGRLRRRELGRFSRFVRDASGRVRRINGRLAILLYKVGRHYAPARLEVVSGYRPGKRRSKSPHRKGVAVDFRVQGVPNAELRDYLRATYKRVGVGYYPNSVFVHFDVRPHNAFWIDYSGPGEDPIYSDDPEGDLRSGRADQYNPSRQGAGTAPRDGGAQAGRAGAGRAATGADSPPPDAPRSGAARSLSHP